MLCSIFGSAELGYSAGASRNRDAEFSTLHQTDLSCYLLTRLPFGLGSIIMAMVISTLMTYISSSDIPPRALYNHLTSRLHDVLLKRHIGWAGGS